MQLFVFFAVYAAIVTAAAWWGTMIFDTKLNEHIASAKSLGDKTMLPKHRAFIAARSSNVSARGVAVMITELR